MLNASLEEIYNDFFPVHVYEFVIDTIYPNQVLATRNTNRECDTIVEKIPRNRLCYSSRNSFIQGTFKDSFRQQLLKDKRRSILKEEIMPLLDMFYYFSALELSIDSVHKYNMKEFKEIYSDEYNRILTSLVFWEYLTDCGNYDLNTRKYFYED